MQHEYQRRTGFANLLAGLWLLALVGGTLAKGTGLLAQGTGGLAWGYNNYGQLGDYSYNNRSLPVRVKGEDVHSDLSDIQALAGGVGHSIALKNNGTLVTWGANLWGELGNGTTEPASYPVPVVGVGGAGVLTEVKAVAVGHAYTVALHNGGTVVAWGYNANGQIGDGTTTNRSTPTVVLGVGGVGNLTDVKAIAAGYYHAMALRNGGTVVAWGANYSGQLGDGTTVDRSTPTVVLGIGGVGILDKVAAIACGRDHSVALKTDGSLVAWGSNQWGQLSDGTSLNSSTPVVVKNANGTTVNAITSIVAGGYHTLALRRNGTVLAWGANTLGQLGNGSTSNSAAPGLVMGVGGSGTLTNIKALTAGLLHSVALRNDGSVVAWGYNRNGELGNGSSDLSVVPVEVKDSGGSGTLNSISAIAAGGSHTLAIRSVILVGTITLLECFNPVQQVHLVFRDPNTEADLYHFSFQLNPDGRFELGGLPTHDYLLAVKGSKWLQKVVPVTIQQDKITEIALSLLPGDANNDNSVDIFDLATLAEDFNSLPGDGNWNEGRSDFNCDDGVDIFDLAVLAAYFNTQGDL